MVIVDFSPEVFRIRVGGSRSVTVVTIVKTVVIVSILSPPLNYFVVQKDYLVLGSVGGTLKKGVVSEVCSCLEKLIDL